MLKLTAQFLPWIKGRHAIESDAKGANYHGQDHRHKTNRDVTTWRTADIDYASGKESREIYQPDNETANNEANSNDSADKEIKDAPIQAHS